MRKIEVVVTTTCDECGFIHTHRTEMDENDEWKPCRDSGIRFNGKTWLCSICHDKHMSDFYRNLKDSVPF